MLQSEMPEIGRGFALYGSVGPSDTDPNSLAIPPSLHAGISTFDEAERTREEEFQIAVWLDEGGRDLSDTDELRNAEFARAINVRQASAPADLARLADNGNHAV